MRLPLKHPCWREPVLCLLRHYAVSGLAKVLDAGTGTRMNLGRKHELRCSSQS